MKWPTVKLKNVALIQMGQSPPSHTYNDRGDGLPFFQGKVDFGAKHPTVRIWCNSPNRIAESGDILLSVRAPVGPTNVADQQCCIGRGLAAIRSLDQAVVLPDFIRYVFKWLEPELSLKGHGSTFNAINRKDVESINFPLPPLSEQRRIVEILDQADALRKKRAEADAKAARILPALFYKMFGDPATNPKGYDVVRLDDLGTPLSGGGFPREEQGLTEGEVPFVKVSDMNRLGNEVFIRTANHWVSKDTLLQLRVKAAPAGTTIFPKIGAAIATNKKRLLVRETAYDNNVIGVIPHKPEWSTYIFAFFLLFDLRRLTRTTALPSIKTSELAALPLPRPDEKAVRGFDKQFRELLSSQEEQRRSNERLDRLFSVLLHRAFTGDLTAKWREAHMKELLQEMEQQAKALKIDDYRLPIEEETTSSIIDLQSEIPHA